MIGLSRLKRAIEDVPTGGMQTGDPKVRLKLCDAQRIEVEFNALISERDSALAQNAELAEEVKKYKHQYNDVSIACRVSNEMLNKDELKINRLEQHNAELVAMVEAMKKGIHHFNRTRGDLNPLFKAAFDTTPTKHLRDRDAEVGRAGFIEGCVYAGDGFCSIPDAQAADQYAEKVRRGEV